MPDFEPLFELKENLYKETCPVLIQSGVLFCTEPEEEDAQPQKMVRLTFRNIDSRPITALYLDLHVFDKANKETEAVRDRRYLVPVAGRDETFGEDMEIPVGEAASSFSVAIRKIEFEGEDVWNGSTSFLYENMPARRPLADAIEDKKMLAQYRRDYRTTMSEAGKGDAVYVPETYKDLWLCTCGEVNREGEERCYHCGAAFEPQLELFENRELLAEHLAVHEQAKAEEAEKARLEAERLAEEARLAAEEAARKAEEERLAAEERVRRRKRNFKIFLWISIPTLIAAAIFVVVLITYLIPQHKYDEAAAMLENNQFDEAVAAFAELEDFGDSAARIPEAKYRKGHYLLEKEQFDEAVLVFEGVLEYEDAEVMITECKYRKALQTLESGAYTDALQQLEALHEYEETGVYIELCHFELGMQAVKADDLKTALLHYKEVNAEHAVEMQSAFCDKGIEIYEAGDEPHALEYFALVTEEALLPKIDAAYYTSAMQFMEAESYDEAMEIFVKLGEYEDCPTQILKIHYLKAQAAEAEKDYALALEEYALAGEYEDAQRKIRDLKYAYGVQLLNQGKVVDSYHVLYEIRNYFPAYKLLVETSAYYRYVYDRNVGPNPNHEELEIVFD